MPVADTEVTGDVSTRVLTTLEEVREVENEWYELWQLDRHATPFQAPPWLLAWWSVFGGQRLFVIAVRREHRLIGLLPLYVSEDCVKGRELLPVGVSLSDYLGGLYAPGYEETAWEAICDVLSRERAGWDSCRLAGLPEGSVELGGIPPGVISSTDQEVDACPVLSLGNAGPDGEGAIPGRFLKDLRYARRRLERERDLRIERADRTSLGTFFDGLIQLHGARWRTQDSSGVLSDYRVRRFHASALPMLYELGVVRLYAMYFDEQLIGVYYGFVHAGRAYYYLSGFDPAFASRSPGNVLVHHAIKEAMAEQSSEFDFLRGAEPYKYRWGASDVKLCERLLTHAGQ